MVLNRVLPELWAPCSIQANSTLAVPHHPLPHLTPTVTPSSVQPVSPPTIVSTSLATDLEGLTLTDSPLVPSVSGMVEGLLGRVCIISVVHPIVWLCVWGDVK